MSSSSPSSSTDWQIELAQAITQPQQLLDLLQLDSSLLCDAQLASRSFSLRVPQGFVARMRKGDPFDPLLLQVLPLGQELINKPDFLQDPLMENKANVVTGLLHKYKDRVLLLATGACAINCRYCFRRHFPYENNNPGMQGWQTALNYIAADKKINEVILSGGDPLLLKDKSLAELVGKIAEIPHIKRLRIHSRLPIVLPARITDELLITLTQTRLQPVMVVHSNHANEIDSHVAYAIARLRVARIPVFNQAVLLKNINDSVAALKNLSEKLFSVGIMPYYLHLLDKVEGTHHFDVPLEKAKALMSELLKELSGYLVPKLVQEQAGALSKLPVI